VWLLSTDKIIAKTMSHVEDEDVDDFLYGDSNNKKAGSIEQNAESG
jgi:hypothetical protein